MPRFEGPKHKGMSNAEKVTVGVAAAVAIGAAASQAGKHQQQTEVTDRPHSQHGGHGSGATALQYLLGARASSGEMQMEDRGYEYVKGQKSGGMAFLNWVKGSHCITIRTENGHYASIVDVTMLDCE
jgi:hypothetical protein